MKASLVILVSLLYLTLLFVIAIYANKRNKLGKSLVNNPIIYALSLTVYCTVWTFYGSVGRSAATGIGFIPVYLGPTLLMPVWYQITRKMILISKHQRITSIADFISSRYGKSTFLGAITTLILVFGIIPYISIQLKAIGFSFDIITQQNAAGGFWDASTFYRDKVNYFTILLAVFTILFGTRSLDPNERHEGLIAAIAFESLIKLIAFVSVGIFVVYFLFDGMGHLFAEGAKYKHTQNLYTVSDKAAFGTSWFWVMVLSASAVIFLPRQFHVSIVENQNITHTRQASWLFPLYLLLISFFVMPIAIAGKLLLDSGVEPDTYVLSLPLWADAPWLALLVYLGGFSAAASMVVISVIALSIMVSNNLLMPLLARTRTAQVEGFALLSERLLSLRRIVIVVIMFLAYAFYKLVSKDFPLVSIGLISFAAILQLVPSAIGGMYWTSASKKGAVAGLLAGFFIWFITLPLPTLAESGIIDADFMNEGYFGLSWLKPYHLFGIEGFDPISHACFWSMFFNLGLFTVISILTSSPVEERTQADVFVNIEKYTGSPDLEVIRREASATRLKDLLYRYLGTSRGRLALKKFKGQIKKGREADDVATPEFIAFVEQTLTGAFGSASAKILIGSDIRQATPTLDELNEMLNQTKEILEYSTALEDKTRELEATTRELNAVNQQLKALDTLKAEFISTVTHELRTPITTIRSFAQILEKDTGLKEEQKKAYLNIVIKECDRIKNLVNQVLDVERLDIPQVLPGNFANAHLLLEESFERLKPQWQARGIEPEMKLNAHDARVVLADDKVLQIFFNLLSNAIKFCDTEDPSLKVISYDLGEKGGWAMEFINNGKVIPHDFRKVIFDKFTQVQDGHRAKPEGSGLGLFITKKLVESAGGEIAVYSDDSQGTRFVLHFPDPGHVDANAFIGFEHI